jgi:16S rRNA (uracil1498-N3)-methyltransferase
MTRIFVDQALRAGARIELPADSARYLKTVLRQREGWVLTVFNGLGGEYRGRLTVMRRDTAVIELDAFVDTDPESPLAITLVQSLARGDRMDYAIQKAVELGVTRIIPLAALRSTLRLTDGRAATRHAHWRGVIVHACEQSGRTRLPELDVPRTIDDVCSRDCAALKLVFERSAAEPLQAIAEETTDVAALIGPEGGFEPEELEQLQQAGYRRARLGPRILRTETAAVAALTAIQLRWGDL